MASSVGRETPSAFSDAHEGLKAAITSVMQSASWQRCKVHFYRNILAHVPQARKLEVAAALRTVFGQVSMESAQRSAGRVSWAIWEDLKQGDCDFRCRGYRRVCVLTLPARASSEHCDDESHRASQQGNPPADAFDRHLSITRIGIASRDDDSYRAERRMDGRAKIYVARKPRTRSSELICL